MVHFMDRKFTSWYLEIITWSYILQSHWSFLNLLKKYYSNSIWNLNPFHATYIARIIFSRYVKTNIGKIRPLICGIRNILFKNNSQLFQIPESFDMRSYDFFFPNGFYSDMILLVLEASCLLDLCIWECGNSSSCPSKF